jgi:hypothetical protein
MEEIFILKMKTKETKGRAIGQGHDPLHFLFYQTKAVLRYLSLYSLLFSTSVLHGYMILVYILFSLKTLN